MVLAGIGHREETWPRDFLRIAKPAGGLMFIGCALRRINKAVDRDAHEDDVRLGKAFIDRPDRDNRHLVESVESQRWAYQRGETARGILLDWLRCGSVEGFWLPEDGQFQQIPQETWKTCPEVTDVALRRFGLADSYYEGRGEPRPTGRRFLYVSAKQLLIGLVILNPGAKHGFPGEPQLILDTVDDVAAEDGPLLTALTWIATRNERATAGALAYLRYREGGAHAEVAASASNSLIEQQIADIFCACRKPNCDCWSSAKVALAQAAQGVTPTIAGFGFRNNGGDAERIPATAWRGALYFDAHSWLEPERSGGTRWGNVYFRADDVRHAFPAKVEGARDQAATAPRPGAWKIWAADAVSRGIGVAAAHADAKAKLAASAPSRDKARELVRNEELRLGIVSKQGPRGPRNS